MIEMWDAGFAGLNPSIGRALKAHKGSLAFDLMHTELDAVWQQCHRILRRARLPASMWAMPYAPWAAHSSHTRITRASSRE